MAFGLFKKKNFADIIYMNGHIYTQDAEFPWASAVACKDGKVLAIGDFDGMEEITGEDTEVVDLNNRYMFPGFIDVHGTPVLKAFEGMYMEIDPIWDLDTVLEMVEEYAEDNDNETIFGYGYNEQILADYETQEEAAALLDEIEADRPVVLLGTSGAHCWMNTPANQIVFAMAEDEGMEFVSTDYVLHALSPLDFEEADERIKGIEEELTDKGITSVLDLCAPDYFSSLYRNSLIAGIGEGSDPKQRFFGSLYVNRPLNPNLIVHKLDFARTDCVELDGLISCDFLKLEVSSDEDLAYFSQEELDAICLAAADKGFHIHLDAIDDEAAEMAKRSFDDARAKGCRRNTFVLASDGVCSDDGEEENFLTTWPTDYLNQSVFSHSCGVSEAIDNLTTGAIELLGVSKDFGSIEQGKNADFTVFEENPLEKTLDYFSKMHADMTIINSLVVYDVDAENEKEIFDMMCSMHM